MILDYIFMKMYMENVANLRFIIYDKIFKNMEISLIEDFF